MVIAEHDLAQSRDGGAHGKRKRSALRPQLDRNGCKSLQVLPPALPPCRLPILHASPLCSFRLAHALAISPHLFPLPFFVPCAFLPPSTSPASRPVVLPSSPHGTENIT